MIEVPNEHPTEYLDMPLGLKGYWWETPNLICVLVVIADQAGDGSFSAFLKGIEDKGKTIFFPSIISARLDEILRSRGYVEGFVNDETFGVVDGLVRLRGE